MLDSALFWEVINTSLFIIDWIIFKFLLDSTGNKKTSNTNSLALIIIAIMFALADNILDMPGNISILVFIIVGTIFCKFNYESNLSRSIILSLIFASMLMGVESLSASFVVLANSISDVKILLESNIYTLEVIIISKILLLIAVLSIIRYLNLFENIRRRDALYIFIPIIANIVILGVVFGYSLNGIKSILINNNLLLFISILIFGSSISLIMVIEKVIIGNKLTLENRIIKEKIYMQYNYYIRLEENQNRVRKLYHDMKNHISCISNICKDNDLANEYIENINVELSNLNNNFNTGNMILNVILDEKNSICISKGIKFRSNIDFTKCEFIDMVDVCSVFSNALDNAIEACDKIEDKNTEKKIELKSTYINNFLVIKIENSKVNEIIRNDNNIVSNKKDSFVHGIGLSNIKSTIKKYSGEVIIDYSENYFIMKIMIPLKDNYPVTHEKRPVAHKVL